MNIYDILRSSPMVHAIGISLIHFLWQGLLVALLLGGVLAALKRNTPQVRYLVACIALLVMFVLPFVTFLHVYPSLPRSPEAEDLVYTLQTTHERLGETERIEQSEPRVRSAPGVSIEEPSASVRGTLRAPRTFREQAADLCDGIAPWFTSLWLVGVAFLSSHLVGGLYFASVLRRRYASLIEDGWQQILDRLRKRLGISRAVVLLQSHRISVPAMIGWTRPAVLLPVSALTGLTPGQIEVLIAHELAHIRRYDYVVNLLQNIVETLLFYHPAVWWVSKQIRNERELCCDDIVLEVCGDARAYAGALADMLTLRMKAPVMALAANGGSLSSRIRRLLGIPQPHTSQVSRVLSGAIVCAMLLALSATLAVSMTGAGERAAMSAREIQLLEMALDYRQKASSHGKLLERELSLEDRSSAADILRELVAEFPARPEYRYLLAETQHQRALMLWGTGRQEEALEAGREAEELLKKLVDEFPDVALPRSKLARVRMDLATAFSAMGMHREAEAADRAALELLETIPDELFPAGLSWPYGSDLAWAYADRGERLLGVGLREEARQADSKALEIAEYFAMEFPFDPEESRPSAPSYHDVANLLTELISKGQAPEAIDALRLAVARSEQQLAAAPGEADTDAKGHWRLSLCLQFLAGRLGKGDEQYTELMTNAVRHAHMAMELDSTRKEYRLHLVDSCRAVANMLAAGGREDEAIQVYERAVPLLERAVDLVPVAGNELAIVLNELGRLREGAGRTEEAQQAYRQAETVRQELVAQFPNLPFEYRSAVKYGGILDYTLRIGTPGEYRLYVRAAGHDYQSDSLLAWIEELADGPGGRIADLFLYQPRADADFGTGAWLSTAWPERRRYSVHAVWPFSDPGDYTIRFMAFEDGVAIDAFAFQLSSLRAPTGDGPEESTATADGVFIESNGRAVVEAEHFTSRSVIPRSAAIELGGNWRTVPDEGAGDVVHSNFRGTGYVQALPDMSPSR